MTKFNLHNGYSRMFQENKLSLGLLFPLESYAGSIPIMDLDEQMKLSK